MPPNSRCGGAHLARFKRAALATGVIVAVGSTCAGRLSAASPGPGVGHALLPSELGHRGPGRPGRRASRPARRLPAGRPATLAPLATPGPEHHRSEAPEVPRLLLLHNGHGIRALTSPGVFQTHAPSQSGAGRRNISTLRETQRSLDGRACRVQTGARCALCTPQGRASTGSVTGTSLRAFLGNLDCLWKLVPMREREGQWRVPKVGCQ